MIPLGVAIIAGMAVLALPRLVSSGAHRAAIEAMAGSLTGREVHIRGKLSLALLPHPQFIAGDVTITSPDQETITASSLTLDIAPFPLLSGQIVARSITLQSPHIALPWPLPGGAAAIAPPRWLAALHAQINDGEISLGAATFTHVSADIFTGSGGAFSVSGSGNLLRTKLHLALASGALSAVGSTPVTLDIQTDDAAKLQVHISGAYDSSSTLYGSATFGAASLAAVASSLSQPVSGEADIIADPGRIALSNLNLRQGNASLSGSATLRLVKPQLTLLLSGQNLVFPFSVGLLHNAISAFGALPAHLALDAANATLTANHTTLPVAQLHTTIDFHPRGADVTSFDADLPGDSHFWSAGTLDAAGALQAKAIFDTTRLNDFIGAFGAGLTLPAAWQEIRLAGDVRGALGRMAFDNLTGNFGPARISGTAVLAQPSQLSGALHFDQLDLTPFMALARNPPNRLGAANALDVDAEISADRGNIGKLSLTHLLIDAELSDQLTVRRLTAGIYGGIAASSFTLAPSPGAGAPAIGLISSAHAILALPSAQPLTTLLPDGLRPPAALAQSPLALSLSAAGPTTALATSASLTLGAVSITAAPSIDLIQQTAVGAFTLRHPDAIAAFKAFGLNAGLAWPGAGSIALRANMLLSPTQIGFSDFVLSMGDLTANGRLIYGPNQQLNGEIDDDTLALPPIPDDFTLPWTELAGLRGDIAVSANRVLMAGNPILGAAKAELGLGSNKIELKIDRASLANGILRGDFSATTSSVPPAAPAAPAIAAQFTVAGADSSLVNLPVRFPITLPAGSVDATADLTASGYAPQAWLATLAGSAGLAAHSGTLNGFNLTGAISALNAKRHRYSLLRNACLSGTTPFTQLNMTGAFNSGVYTLNEAKLQSPAGSATATGSIDIPDMGTNFNITLLPNVPSPPQLGLTIAGSWTSPRTETQLKQALSWKAAARK